MGWKPWTGVRRRAGLLALAAVLALASPAQANITYIYDALGRLRAVIDPSQTDGTVIYSYDAVGNILSITRQPASQVTIIEFTPKSGPIGTTVTVQGTGFSATPGQNTVTFNGVAATGRWSAGHGPARACRRQWRRRAITRAISNLPSAARR